MIFGKKIQWLFFVLASTISAFSQSIVNGSVVDQETGLPVPFASIGIMGTSKGTSSNLNGEFSLAIPAGATIKITCVGYESLTLNASGLSGTIKLRPQTTHLNEVFVLAKAQNPRTVVRKAFANLSNNYSKESFLQKFFYRHYCKDDSVFGRLIEASVDVLKHQGYRTIRSRAGDKEEIQVAQLRRSLDKTVMAQGHEPISVHNILQADLVGYQSPVKSEHLKFYEEASSLRTDFESYTFALEGITTHDGLEVYKISYQSKPDSILTTAGYLPATTARGTLFIVMDSYALIKSEDIKQDGPNWIRTSAYYQKYGDYYYPYHFVREGESRFSDNHEHSFHIELMSVEIQHSSTSKIRSNPLDKESLLKIAYDSAFWSTHTVLKTTPLEDDIIHDLGGGRSLNDQFYRYQQYEWSTADGGKNGSEKFKWFLEDSQGERILYLGFISNHCQPYLNELEHLKKLSKAYRTHIAFVLIMIENDETKWQQVVTRYTLFADGIINYRIEVGSDLVKRFKVNETPAFLLLSKEGTPLDPGATVPSNPLLEAFLKNVIKPGNSQ